MLIPQFSTISGAVGVGIGQSVFLCTELYYTHILIAFCHRHRMRAKYTNDGKIYIGSEVLLQIEPYGGSSYIFVCCL